MAKRLSVIVSQSQSANPAKRKLEEDIVTALLFENGIDVTVIPDLYHLKSEGTAMLALQGVTGDMVVMSWMYERGARWILDRNQICGQEGQTLLVRDDDAEDEDSVDDEEKSRVIETRDLPNRKIYTVDLRVSDSAEEYITEIKRIASEGATKVVELGDWLQGTPTPEQQARFDNPTNNTAVGAVTPPPAKERHNSNGAEGNGAEGNGAEVNGAEANNARINGDAKNDDAKNDTAAAIVHRVDEQGVRRWYPVIDFSRCTNCMECIDFCLFGVYGIDGAETILVEQPDNCRKGCPACSRVCPENAIIFPQHKTPAIAGAQVESSSLKIDLSRLFGAPDETPEQAAARERDEQLVIAGRDAVGMTVGIPKRQVENDAAPKDELDDLLDELDDLDL